MRDAGKTTPGVAGRLKSSTVDEFRLAVRTFLNFHFRPRRTSPTSWPSRWPNARDAPWVAARSRGPETRVPVEEQPPEAAVMRVATSPDHGLRLDLDDSARERP